MRTVEWCANCTLTKARGEANFFLTTSISEYSSEMFLYAMFNREFRNLAGDRRGFTLAEILIAVAVFGILAATAVPQFIAFRPKSRLNGAARQVYSELMWARSKAVNENSAYVVTFPTNQTIQITGSTTKTVSIQSEYSDVTLTSSASTITFSSRGTADVAPTITLTNSGGTKTVTVRITGTASIS